MIYVVAEAGEVVMKCTTHPDYLHTFSGESSERMVAGILEDVIPASWVTIAVNEHIRLSHVALPASMS